MTNRPLTDEETKIYTTNLASNEEQLRFWLYEQETCERLLDRGIDIKAIAEKHAAKQKLSQISTEVLTLQFTIDDCKDKLANGVPPQNTEGNEE